MNKPIGVFDSGIGGLSVLKELVEILPNEHYIYVADQAHVPYGGRERDEIRHFSKVITQFFLEKGVKIIVVACNTATGAALNWLRDQFPDVTFVGMEPAVKPAAARSRTGIIGVLATAGTIKSDRYVNLKTRYGSGIEVLENPCPGLVPLIESGQADSEESKEMLEQVLQPMLDKGIDNLVLGCTHYPFIAKVLAEILPEDVTIINPAPAVASHTRNLLMHKKAVGEGELVLDFFTTGKPEGQRAQIENLIPETLSKAEKVDFQGISTALFSGTLD
jgi:glutamate racemase